MTLNELLTLFEHRLSITVIAQVVQKLNEYIEEQKEAIERKCHLACMEYDQSKDRADEDGDYISATTREAKS